MDYGSEEEREAFLCEGRDADSLMDLCGFPLVLTPELSHRAHILWRVD